MERAQAAAQEGRDTEMDTLGRETPESVDSIWMKKYMTYQAGVGA